jgi:hypothetical protein
MIAPVEAVSRVGAALRVLQRGDRLEPSGSQCSSACFLLFAAAGQRAVAPDALIGVHSASDNGQENINSMAFTTAFAREAAAYGV